MFLFFSFFAECWQNYRSGCQSCEWACSLSGIQHWLFHHKYISILEQGGTKATCKADRWQVCLVKIKCISAQNSQATPWAVVPSRGNNRSSGQDRFHGGCHRGVQRAAEGCFWGGSATDKGSEIWGFPCDQFHLKLSPSLQNTPTPEVIEKLKKIVADEKGEVSSSHACFFHAQNFLFYLFPRFQSPNLHRCCLKRERMHLLKHWRRCAVWLWTFSPFNCQIFYSICWHPHLSKIYEFWTIRLVIRRN